MKYQLGVGRRVYEYTVIEVEASSAEEAIEKARALSCDIPMSEWKADVDEVNADIMEVNDE